MATGTIDHTTLSKLAEAGAVHSAHVIGQAGGWEILIKYGITDHILTTQRSQQTRIFRKLETLVNYLKGLGIARFEVDAMNYDPTSPETARSRPDSAAQMKRAHEAAAYDKWLKAEIQEALDDSSPAISHDEVMRDVRAAIQRARVKRASA